MLQHTLWPATVSYSGLSDTLAAAYPGAIDVKNGANILIQDSTFVDNIGTIGGAVIVELNSGSIIQVCTAFAPVTDTMMCMCNASQPWSQSQNPGHSTTAVPRQSVQSTECECAVFHSCLGMKPSAATLPSRTAASTTRESMLDWLRSVACDQILQACRTAVHVRRQQPPLQTCWPFLHTSAAFTRLAWQHVWYPAVIWVQSLASRLAKHRLTWTVVSHES